MPPKQCTPKKLYTCATCGRTFSRKFNLQRHVELQKCTNFTFPTEHTYYVPMIKHLTGALQAPVNDALLPYLWQSTCLYAHASPNTAFDAFWKLVNLLTPAQLTTVFQYDHTVIQTPANMPTIMASLHKHMQQLKEAGVKHIGKHALTDVLEALPQYPDE